MPTLSTKETTELLRAFSAVLIEVMDATEDGDYDFGEKIRALSLIPVVMRGIKGISQVRAELADLQPDERDALILEIRESLIRSKALSHRAADIAADIFHLAYYNVNAVLYMLRRPAVAELVE